MNIYFDIIRKDLLTVLTLTRKNTKTTDI